MRVIDLVKMCRYEDVEKELKAHYDDFPKEKRKFAPESILAHALWELTAYSFEEKSD